MGYNTTVVIMNDALHEIEADKEFGKKVSNAEGQLWSRVREDKRGIDIQSGAHVNAATVIETHHANETVIIAVGGNYATVIGSIYGLSKHHEPEDKERILRALAKEMGFSLRKMRNGE